MTHEQAWRMITAANRILMTTHVKPDGDGLGTLAALAEVLAGLGKTVRVVLGSPAPPKYQFVRGVADFEVLGRDVTLDTLPAHWDLLVVIDTCTWSQLEELRPLVRDHAGRILVIDHHKTSDDLGHEALTDPHAAATGPIVMTMLEAAGVALSPTMAEALFVSLASDTGWYQFPNVTPDVFHMAAQLQQCGARPQAIYEGLFQSDSLARMRLLGEALPTLSVCPEGDVATLHVTRDMFARAGAESWDTENLINETQRIAGVVLSIMCVEQDGGAVRVSLRSKRDVDVSDVAMEFGGGGHARAAGCTLKGPLADASRAVLEVVYRAMARPPGPDPTPPA